MFVLCCEANGKIVAEGEVERKKRWIERHVAEIRFGVLPSYETEAYQMIKQLMQIAKKNEIEVLIYFHLVTQKSGLNIMNKAGFKIFGTLKNYYKRKKEYINRVYMMKIL